MILSDEWSGTSSCGDDTADAGEESPFAPEHGIWWTGERRAALEAELEGIGKRDDASAGTWVYLGPPAPLENEPPPAGSKISVVFWAEVAKATTSVVLEDPPAISTRPSGSRVAVCPIRLLAMLPADVKVFVTGS